MDFSSYKDSQHSPLAQSLFRIDGVSGVFFSVDFLTITVRDGSDWSIIKPEVLSTMTDFFHSDRPVILPSETLRQSDTTITEEDDEVVAMIKEVIEFHARPTVMEDGGDIVFKGFDRERGIVKLQLQGACKTCSSSERTLRNGVENLLMHYIPEVQGIEEYIDEEVESVSKNVLHQLEEKLANATANTTNSPL